MCRTGHIRQRSLGSREIRYTLGTRSLDRQAPDRDQHDSLRPQRAAEPLQPQSLTQQFTRLSCVKDLPGVRFHDLPDSDATQLLGHAAHRRSPQSGFGLLDHDDT
jgi:hypothetical protein